MAAGRDRFELGRIEPVERHEMNAFDVDCMLRRGSHIKERELSAVLKTVVELALSDGLILLIVFRRGHRQWCLL